MDPYTWAPYVGLLPLSALLLVPDLASPPVALIDANLVTTIVDAARKYTIIGTGQLELLAAIVAVSDQNRHCVEASPGVAEFFGHIRAVEVATMGVLVELLLNEGCCSGGNNDASGGKRAGELAAVARAMTRLSPAGSESPILEPIYMISSSATESEEGVAEDVLLAILARKSPLGTVWIAAHLERKIKKPQIDGIDIPTYADVVAEQYSLSIQEYSSDLLGSSRSRADMISCKLHTVVQRLS
ncbi:hypothetical protein HU200_033638 [Digitaria exilis]|uniref:Rad21/Rec8-like protein N-terminal domain-containing protein n=1 Tax=Digitaria exilis TaxID=1010633 RepID=A0A835BWR5_9POAL|nr:hypothetical protein HU200_033638 [Digitaria exilis]